METEEGRLWLETAHHAAISRYSDLLTDQSGADEAQGIVLGTTPDDQENGETIIVI